MKTFEPNDTIDTKIVKWADNSNLLKLLKKVEMEQRTHLFNILFPSPKVGTNNFDLGKGYKVKGVHGYTNSLDKAAFELMQAEIANLSQEDQQLIREAVKWEPSLVAKGYKNLSDTAKEVFDEAVVTKPKAITLELVIPKDKL